MANIKPKLRKLLITDETLAALFQAAGVEPKVMPSSEFSAGRIPVITFDEDDNVPALTGDGKELASEIIVTVHVWATGTTNVWMDAVDNVMRINFRGRRITAPELSESKGGVMIYHRPIRYRCLVANN